MQQLPLATCTYSSLFQLSSFRSISLELLQAEARRVMQQLRLACLHPQMTEYWRELAGELQLDRVRCLEGLRSCE